ncbi:hypothetical protein BHE74_00006100 [Ensete ventricosum]|nr:hypothetical protein BHE74_00006100 [Ensete ventricosum]
MTAMGDEESASPIASTRGAKIEDDTVDGKVATFLSMVPSWTPRKRISDLETAVKAIEENLGVTEHKARDAAEIHARKPTANMERLVSLMHSLALVSAVECGVVAMAAAAAVLCLRLSDRSQV